MSNVALLCICWSRGFALNVRNYPGGVVTMLVSVLQNAMLGKLPGTHCNMISRSSSYSHLWHSLTLEDIVLLLQSCVWMRSVHVMPFCFFTRGGDRVNLTGCLHSYLKTFEPVAGRKQWWVIRSLFSRTLPCTSFQTGKLFNPQTHFSFMTLHHEVSKMFRLSRVFRWSAAQTWLALLRCRSFLHLFLQKWVVLCHVYLWKAPGCRLKALLKARTLTFCVGGGNYTP